MQKGLRGAPFFWPRNPALRPYLARPSALSAACTAGRAPTRAVQRITAVNLTAADAKLLLLPEGAAVLRIDRTAYLPSGRPIEFTRGLYRSDIYDFIAELRLDAP